MTLLSPAFSLLAVFAVGALSYNITYTFPDCKNGPLKNNLVCDSTAGYYERADALVSAMNLSEVIAQVNENFTGTPRLGLPAYIWWSEALHGIAYSPGSVSPFCPYFIPTYSMRHAQCILHRQWTL
jgi:beta-D-xylosidase 4